MKKKDKVNVLIVPHQMVDKVVKGFKKSCRTCIFAEKIIDSPKKGSPTQREVLSIARKVAPEAYVVQCSLWRKNGLGHIVMISDPDDNSLKNHDIRRCYKANVVFDKKKGAFEV